MVEQYELPTKEDAITQTKHCFDCDGRSNALNCQGYMPDGGQGCLWSKILDNNMRSLRERRKVEDLDFSLLLEI